MDRPLLAVPNVSEGRDAARIGALEEAFAAGVALLDRHSDADHNRTVLTLAGEAGALRGALVRGAVEAVDSIDMTAHDGVCTRRSARSTSARSSGVAPKERDRARALAIEVAAEIGALGVPVFLYGELAAGPAHVERAYFRSGGLAELWLRMEAGELRPDRGPALPHRTAGVTLVTARPTLGAFNVELDSDDLDVARAVAAGLRESGGGIAGVRAIGLPLASGRTQVSTNVHDPTATPLGEVVERVRDLAAPLGARPVEAELIGLIPAAAWPAFQRTCRSATSTPSGRRSSAASPPLGERRPGCTRFTAWPRPGRSAAESTAAPREAGSTRTAAAAARAAARRRRRAPAPAASPRRRPTRRRPGAARSRAAPPQRPSSPCCCSCSFKRPIGVSLGLGAFMLVFYIPAGY